MFRQGQVIGILIALSCNPTAARNIDFSATILGPDGQALTTCEAKTPDCQSPITLGRVASAALFNTYADETDQRGVGMISGDEKARRADLGLSVRNAGVSDLRVEDISLIKRLVGKMYGPLIVKRAYDLLDPQVSK